MEQLTGCDRSAMIGTEQGNYQEDICSDNYLGEGELGNEKDCLSANVIDQSQMRPAGLEPATCGLGNRRSILTELRARKHFPSL